MTRSFTTYNTKLRREVTIAADGGRDRKFRASNDPRFKRLKTTLVPPEKPIDAVLQLSPSGRKVMENYGSTLYDENEFQAILVRLNSEFPAREKPPKPKIDLNKRKILYRPHVVRQRFLSARYLSQQEAFISDGSFYSSPSFSDLSSEILSEAE